MTFYKKYAVLTLLAAFSAMPEPAHAFCGFYVAKADAKLYNKASKVVVARSDEKTVVTMASDYQGDPKEFAVVIPVPTVITKEQVHITENALVEHIDAYSAPRLVEYFDPNPCQPMRMMEGAVMKSMNMAAAPAMASADRGATLGVKIEAQYTVGEYDILILSAKQSGGLETFLKESGYKIPEGASAVLGSYIKQEMKFFVAKVNLKEQEKRGGSYLRPIQVAYESPKFMLPIRLGTVNADGPQELFIFMLTPKGRVETTNYRTIEIPSNTDIPLYAKQEFGDFYKAMFDTQVKKNDMRGVFLEYAWNMGMCDPCSADPIPNDKLIELGAFWLTQQQPYPAPMPPVVMGGPGYPGGTPPQSNIIIGRPYPGPQQAFITRLHVRYDRDHFPEDLMFQETSNNASFQGRYVLHHPWAGGETCQAAEEYRNGLPSRFSKEAENLAQLTGWDISGIRKKMEENGQSFNPAIIGEGHKWYQQMWQKP